MSNKNNSEALKALREKGVVVTDDQPEVDPISLDKDFKEVVDDEAFMNERITIVVFPTTDKNAPPYATVSVNGERAIVPRARPVEVRRKHVEVLARMRETIYSQDEVAPGVEITMDSLRGHTALVYPFQVTKDANPRGPAWLERILMEPSY
ncbi:MAG: hypothetical protein JO142_10460 [Burkholderiales bacterium]|nr:hypothetical protein [Burkholderiales bacterium]